MKRVMSLVEIKNTLNDNVSVPKLRLKNSSYEITVSYLGKIGNETEKRFDPSYLKIRCKPLDSDIIIGNNGLRLFIDTISSHFCSIYNETDLRKTKQQLDTAYETMCDLQQILSKYFA